MTTATPPCSPYDVIGQEEADEARERVPTGGGNTVEDQPTSQTNLRTQGDPGARNQDTGKRYIADPPSPTDLSGCLTCGARRSMGKYVWNQLVRVKRVIVRSTSLSFGVM